MSGSDDIISFDLRHGHGTVIDLASMMPLTSLYSPHHTSGGNTVDDMRQKRETPNFFYRMRLSINRFRTLETLDLATQEIRDITFSDFKKENTRRKKILTIIKPLYIPYASLDIRRYGKYMSDRRYPDLFVRSLPYKLMMRRTVKTID